jgi:hypothetical protein
MNPLLALALSIGIFSLLALATGIKGLVTKRLHKRNRP